MHALKIIDVTLRDGGHRVNFKFSQPDLRELLYLLNAASVDYVEIGYRNGIWPVSSNIGPSGVCHNSYIEFCRKHLPQVKMSVMIYPQNATLSDIPTLKSLGVDLLRVCIGKSELASARKLIEFAANQYLPLSINVTHTSSYHSDELDDLIADIRQLPCAVIYLADSNGSFIPDRIHDIYTHFTQRYSIPFGFHAHDNLGLAQANAIAAMKAGAQFIDCSLAGLGKGIGNLRAEFFVAYLQCIHIGNYQLDKLLTAANYIRRVVLKESHLIELEELLRAICNR